MITADTDVAAAAALVLLVLQNSASLVLLHSLQNGSDGQPYEPLTVVVLSEILKLFISILLIIRTASNDAVFSAWGPSLRDARRQAQDGHFRSAIPAVLYTISAVCQSVGARNLDPLSFVMLSQAKLMLTPLYRLGMLGRTFGKRQWIFLIVMIAGIVISETGTRPSSSGSSQQGNPAVAQSQRAITGLLSMFIAGNCVAYAGVHQEVILKTVDKFMIRNAQLAAYSCLCAVLGLSWKFANASGPTITVARKAMRGLHGLVWVLIALQAAGGFIVAWSLHASSAVAKNSAQALGFVVASITFMTFSEEKAKVNSILGITCVIAGVVGSLFCNQKSKDKQDCRDSQEIMLEKGMGQPSLEDYNINAALQSSHQSEISVIELGAGTGLTGLSAAAIWSTNSLLTDLPGIVPGLEENARLNSEAIKRMGGSVSCGTLDWNMPETCHIHDNGRISRTLSIKEVNGFPLVLAADTMYTEDHPQLLSQTVSKCLRNSVDARAIICYPMRIAYLDHIREFWELMDEQGLAPEQEGREEIDMEGWDDERLHEWSIWKWKDQ
ncbi:UDP-N-acetylglucosamine transporter [Paramyrothecium foliicola]|nr:UDP-N-acetylglucosamine transporter [Paramyrothecium foliicola]